MKKEDLRSVVRSVLSEMEMAIGGGGWDSNNDISRFHGYPSGYGQFPYLYTDTPEMLPDSDEVNRANAESNFNSFLNNNEAYEFPTDQFQNGMEIEAQEMKKNGQFVNVFDLAKKVIDNIQKDRNHYQNEDARNT